MLPINIQSLSEISLLKMMCHFPMPIFVTNRHYLVLSHITGPRTSRAIWMHAFIVRTIYDFGFYSIDEETFHDTPIYK